MFFFLFFTYTLFQIYECLDILYSPPKMVQLSPISSPSNIYGQATKLRVNSKFIIRLSNTSRIDIWQTNDNSFLLSLNAQNYPFNFDVGIYFMDFCLQNQNHDLIGILSEQKFILYNVTNNSILNEFINSNLNQQWRKCLLTKQNLIIIIQDNIQLIKTISRYNRNTNNISGSFQINEYNYSVYGQVCEGHSNTLNYIFWNQNFKLYYYQCINNTCSNGFVKDGHPPIDYKSARVTFSKDCNYFYYEIDHRMNSNIYKFPNIVHKQLFNYQNILNFNRFDERDIYSFYILTNQSFLIYKNNLQNQFQPEFISNYHLSESIKSLYQFQRYNSNFFIAKQQYIVFLKFQCKNGSYMIETNLCVSCSDTCLQCNHVNGNCNSCINDQYILNNNGLCILKQQSSNSSSSFQIKNNIINFILPRFLSIMEIVLIGSRILSIPIFSYFFLNFINFWSIISIYTLLKIKTTDYLKQILDKIYLFANISVLDFLDKIVSVKPLIQKWTQNLLQQKINPYYTQKYGLSSKIIQNNFEQFSLLFLSYFALFILILCRKYLFKKTLISIKN